MKEQKLQGLNELAQEIHQNNVAKGFYDSPKNIGEMLCLIHSEVSEALEAHRKSITVLPTVDMPTMNTILDDVQFAETYKEHVKGTFEEEMADILIRVLDLCEFLKIDLTQHTFAKTKAGKIVRLFWGAVKFLGLVGKAKQAVLKEAGKL